MGLWPVKLREPLSPIPIPLRPGEPEPLLELKPVLDRTYDEAGYEDLSPLLQAYDRALLGGGTPHDAPELMRDRNPINFTDNVRVPVFFLIGENDSRCPYDQAIAYVDRLAARDHPHEVYVFPTGHSPFDVDERVRQVQKVLDFLTRHAPGLKTA